MKKLKVFLTLCLTSALVFTGCSGASDTKETDPSEPIPTSELEEEGYYILGSDGNYYRPNTDGQNFTGTVTNADSSRVVVSKNNSKFIPKFYTDDMLVYFSSGTVPDEFYVERFRNTGYTIGLYGLSLGSNGRYSFDKSDIVSGSDLESQIGSLMTEERIATILTVNGRALTEEAVTSAGSLGGLEKGDEVTIEYMIGTYYGSFTTIADEILFYSSATTTINSYRTTKNGYIVLDMPETKGYMSIEGIGLMKVMDEARPSEKEK